MLPRRCWLWWMEVAAVLGNRGPTLGGREGGLTPAWDHAGYWGLAVPQAPRESSHYSQGSPSGSRTSLGLSFSAFKMDPFTPSHCDVRGPLAHTRLWSVSSEEPEVKGDEHRLCGQAPAPPFTHCVTSGKSLRPSGPLFPLFVDRG